MGEYAHRCCNSKVDCDKKQELNGKLFTILDRRCEIEFNRVREDKLAFHAEPAKVLVDLAPWAKQQNGLKPGARVLVFGPKQTVHKALKCWGASVFQWSRYADGMHAHPRTSAWLPAALSSEKMDACVFRCPTSADSLEMALHAVATILPQNAPLWIYGD